MKLALALVLGFVSVSAFGDIKSDKKVFRNPLFGALFLDMKDTAAMASLNGKCENIKEQEQKGMKIVSCYAERQPGMYSSPVATVYFSDSRVIMFRFVFGFGRQAWSAAESILTEAFKRSADQKLPNAQCWGDEQVKSAWIQIMGTGQVFVSVKNQEVLNRKLQQ